MKILNQNEMLQVFGGDKQDRERRKRQREYERAQRKKAREESRNNHPVLNG